MISASRLTDPLTSMPLRPWQLTVHPVGVGVTSRCVRDTRGWTICTSLSGDLPTVKDVVNV